MAKIRHAGYLHAKNKMERIAPVCKELKLPPPMQKVYTSVALRLLLQTGKDIMACPVCSKGQMMLVKTLINFHGVLIDNTTPQPWFTQNKKERMQQIIKTPDQILKLFILENRDCFWSRAAVLFPQKIIDSKDQFNIFIKISDQKMHRKTPSRIAA